MDTFKREQSSVGKLEGIEQYEQQTGLTLLEVLGYNSYLKGEKSMILDVVNDTNHISQGSNITVGPSNNILIQLSEDTTIHDMMTYAIAANLTLSGTTNTTYSIMDALTLFDPLNFMAGKKSYPMSGCEQYPKAHLLLQNRAFVEPYAYGMAMDLDCYSNYINTYNLARTSGFDGTTNGFAPIFQQAMRNNAIRFNTAANTDTSVVNLLGGGHGDSLIVVPLMFLFPNVLQHLQGSTLYSGGGQVIKMNLQTNPAKRCVFDLTAATTNGTYTLSNIALVRQFKGLDERSIDSIKRSKIMFPCREVQPFPVSPITTSNNFIFSINPDERPSRFIFCAAPTNYGPVAALPMLTQNQILQPNFVWSDVVLFPSLPINLIQIRMGSDVINVNSQTIKVAHVLQASQGHNGLGDCNYYQGGNMSDGILRQLQCVYAVDLSPYPFALTGSDDTGQVNIRIDLDISVVNNAPNEIQSSTLFSSATANLANLSFYGFLEKIKPLELSMGQYK